MANSFTLNSSAYDGRYLSLSCAQSAEIAANRSKISWVLSAVGGSVNLYSTGPTTVTINGTQVYYCERKEWSSGVFPAAKGRVEGVLYVNHSADGSKSVSVSITTAIFSSTASTASGTWALNDIPRKATVASASDFTDETNPTIKFSNPGGLSVAPYFNVYSKSGDRVFSINRAKGSYSSPYTFTLTDAERTSLRKATISQSSYEVWAGVQTYSGSAGLGYSSLQATLTIVNANPTAALTVTAVNDGADNPFGMTYVQGKSKVSGAITGTAKKYASIKSYAANVNGVQYTASSFVGGPFSSSGNAVVTATVKDSRGLSGHATATVSVTPYSAPQITSFTVERQSDGTTVIAKLKAEIASVDSKNTKSIKITLNEVEQEITADGYSVDASTTFENVPTDQTLTAIAKVADYYTEVTKSATLPTVAVTMDFHSSGKGVAFGKVAEEANVLDIAWGVKIDGDALSDFVIEEGTSGIWAYRKWASGIYECWGEYSGSVSVSNHLSGAYYSNSITVNYPISFAVPAIFTVDGGSNDKINWVRKFAENRTDRATFLVIALEQQSSVQVSVNLRVCGRWKESNN